MFTIGDYTAFFIEVVVSHGFDGCCMSNNLRGKCVCVMMYRCNWKIIETGSFPEDSQRRSCFNPFAHLAPSFAMSIVAVQLEPHFTFSSSPSSPSTGASETLCSCAVSGCASAHVPSFGIGLWRVWYRHPSLSKVKQVTPLRSYVRRTEKRQGWAYLHRLGQSSRHFGFGRLWRQGRLGKRF